MLARAVEGGMEDGAGEAGPPLPGRSAPAPTRGRARLHRMHPLPCATKAGHAGPVEKQREAVVTLSLFFECRPVYHAEGMM